MLGLGETVVAFCPAAAWGADGLEFTGAFIVPAVAALFPTFVADVFTEDEVPSPALGAAGDPESVFAPTV